MSKFSKTACNRKSSRFASSSEKELRAKLKQRTTRQRVLRQEPQLQRLRDDRHRQLPRWFLIDSRRKLAPSRKKPASPMRRTRWAREISPVSSESIKASAQFSLSLMISNWFKTQLRQPQAPQPPRTSQARKKCARTPNALSISITRYQDQRQQAL